MRRFAVTTSGSKAAETTDSMAQCQPGSESIASAERWHVALVDVPGSSDEGRKQASGENASGLQRVDAENLAGVGRVVAPLVDDVKNLGADDAAKDDENAEIPSIVAVVAETLGVAHADPQT